MYSLLKSSGLSSFQTPKSWNLFSNLFCCHAKIDPLLSPKHASSYATFYARADVDTMSDNEAVEGGRNEIRNTVSRTQPRGLERPATLVMIQDQGAKDDQDCTAESPLLGLKCEQSPESSRPPRSNPPEAPPIKKLKNHTGGVLETTSTLSETRPLETDSCLGWASRDENDDPTQSSGTGANSNAEPSGKLCAGDNQLIYSVFGENGTETGLALVGADALTPTDGFGGCVYDKALVRFGDCRSSKSSSGVSSLASTQPNSMEFDDENTPLLAKQDTSPAPHKPRLSRLCELDPTSASKLEFPADLTSNQSLEHLNALLNKAFLQLATEEELLGAVNGAPTPHEILASLERYVGPVTPFLAITCIHQIYIVALKMHSRNSPPYNKLCGEVLTNHKFRELVALVQEHAKQLGNFALLTAASDLLYLRLTLKQATIPTLLSYVDYETMDLDELRLLASCLHTPNIPMVNSEYMYNISASVAMRHIALIDDLYTLLNIMKCFGRYFTHAVKRQCEAKVVSLSHEFTGLYPDGRSMSAHMLDAFFRMEHAPLRPLLQQASDAIIQGNVPIQPQDISAILRYFVKFGYTLATHDLLNKLSTTLYSYLPADHAAQFTTNVKWLTVFYHFNPELLERFVTIVKRDMCDLDFVALSDVLDALAQVYYLPVEADTFFERLHDEMLRKLPTLTTSHVHNAKRKLLLTAFHFAVFGRYPDKLIQLTLNDRQNLKMGRQCPSRYFMKDLCRAVSIERPDLLPCHTIPRDMLADPQAPLKLYAFEKDVEQHLATVVGGANYFGVIVSPVRNMPVFILRKSTRGDGELLRVGRNPAVVPPHMHQTVQNIAILPLPRSRFCINSRHAVGKSRFVLRLLRAQGARVVAVPHYDWDQHDSRRKLALLRHKIYQQKADDVVG